MNNLRHLVFSISILAFSLSVIGQEKPDPGIFEQDEFVWCGLDFSEAQFVGSEGFTNPHDIVTNYFHKWNYLMLAESDKYNFREAYDKTTQIDDLSLAKKNGKSGSLMTPNSWATF